MRTDRRRRHQRGLASVETVLVLPFLLFFVLAAVAATQLMLVKQHNTASVRTTAWRHSLLEAPCRRPSRTLYGGSLGAVRCTDTRTNASRFYRLPGTGGRSRPFVATLRRAPAPSATRAVASANYQAARTQVAIEDRHSIDATPVWEMEDLPLGYDVHLRRQLSRTLFPNYFPRVR